MSTATTSHHVPTVAEPTQHSFVETAHPNENTHATELLDRSQSPQGAVPAHPENTLNATIKKKQLELWSVDDVITWVRNWDHTFHRVLAFWTAAMTAKLEAEKADGLLLASMTVDEMQERFDLGKEQAYLFHSALGRVEHIFPTDMEFADLDSIKLDDGEDLTQKHSDPTQLPSLAGRLERIRQLEKLAKGTTSNASTVVGMLDEEATRCNVIVGQLAFSEVTAICQAAEMEVAELDAKTRTLQQQRKRALIIKENAVRDRLAVEQEHINEMMRRLEMKLVNVEREILRKLRRRFRQHEERMRVRLEDNQAIIQQTDGRVSLSGDSFGHTNRCYAIEWSNSPQPMALHIRCLRAVKEKLPMGRYVIVCTLFDSLGGSGLRWSKLDVNEGWNDVTSPFHHGGRFDEIELSIDQVIRIVVPCAHDLVPSMALVFELVKLDDSGSGEVVGWGVFPACDAATNHIDGKFKTQLLAGPIDHSLDGYSKIEQCMSGDLNRWLCNMYFEAELLPKMSEETRQRHYELPMQYTGELLGFDLFHKHTGETTFPENEVYNMKYRKIIQRASQRGKWKRLEGSGRHLSIDDISKIARIRAQSAKAISTVRSAGGLHTSQAMSPWESYTCAVDVSGADGMPVRRGVCGRLRVVWLELVWEIQCEAQSWTRAGSFWMRVLCALFAGVVCHYVHYSGQYVFIWIFMEEPTATIDLLPPVLVTYSTETLRPKHELAVVASGMVANLVDLLFLVMAAAVSVFLYDGIHPLFSHFVDAFAILTFASPLIIAVIDIFRLNWNGDMFKMFEIYSELDGDGAIGLLMTVCTYTLLELLIGTLSYYYFIHVHMSGRVRDSIMRIEATAAELIVPGDLELSYNELEFLTAVDNWQKGGARRVVTITNHTKMVTDPTLSRSCLERFRWRRDRGAKLGDAISGSLRKMNAKTREVPKIREEVIRIWIHTHTSDGQVHLHRSFERSPDGRIEEMFHEKTAKDWSKDSMKKSLAVSQTDALSAVKMALLKSRREGDSAPIHDNRHSTTRQPRPVVSFKGSRRALQGLRRMRG
eukprot:SAG31_NODE_130_length_23424_cov_45.648802_15_plen_1046_part_00